MKRFLFVFLITCCSIEAQPEFTNELELLDRLIEVTQDNLQNQKQLRQLIVQYQLLQAKYMENTNDRELLYQLIKKAHQVLEIIKENHLTQAFDSEFIGELTLFSQVATKRGLPKS